MSARLLGVAIVPLLVLVVAGIDRITDDRVAAAAASDLVGVVELQRDAAAVLPRAQLERVSLSGLAAVDELGLPRDLIAQFTGLDFEEIYDSNAVELDLVLDRLQRHHGDVELLDGSTLVERLGFLRGALQVQRDLSANGRADASDVAAVFEDIDALFAELLAADRSGEANASLDRHRIRLAALGDVLLSGGDVTRATIDRLIGGSNDDTERQVAHAVHSTHVDIFESYLDPAELEQFRTSVVGAEDFEAVEFDTSTLLSDPTAIEAAAQAVLSVLDDLDALTTYSDGFHDRTAGDVRADADRARDRSRTTTLWLLSITAATLVATGLVLWSILRPLRRLTKRARQVSSGVLDQPPLPVRGPRDVRALTSTMNDMAAALDRVNHHIGRMAAGDASPDGASDLPGPIGVSFRSSVERLTAVTEQLQRSEALSTAIVAQADDAIWTIDEQGDVVTANEASARLTGIEIDAQIGRPIDQLLNRTNGEAEVLTQSAPRRRALVAQSVIDIGDQRVTAVIAHDISERAEFEERLAYQAKHDALTGLPNRFAVLEHLAELSAEHPGHVAVLYLDLDGFKSVNDAQGHGVGDRVLAQVGATISDTVRRGEFVGRLGGDEFVVISDRFTQLADVVALGHRIVREVELPQDVDGKLFSLSASVGIAVPPAGVEPLDMIGQADAAVYQAKQRGRGLVEMFDHEMQLSIERTSEIERSLLPAIVNGELELHLQPIVDLATGSITGAEALVRWRRPGVGLVPPGDFIPVAERSSLILDLDRWVLTEACRLLADWERRVPDRTISLSVNISGRHLVDADLLDDVEAALALSGADAGRLILELTETRLLEDLDGATETLQALRGRGVKIAVDDFGTGYSSMTYLRSLPIDTLKIDRSFVSRATEHGFDSTVVEAILTMARALELRVVAEGVETGDQLDFVRARGCDEAQGFLLARPMPVEDAEAMLFALDALDGLDVLDATR